MTPVERQSIPDAKSSLKPTQPENKTVPIRNVTKKQLESSFEVIAQANNTSRRDAIGIGRVDVITQQKSRELAEQMVKEDIAAKGFFGKIGSSLIKPYLERKQAKRIRGVWREQREQPRLDQLDQTQPQLLTKEHRKQQETANRLGEELSAQAVYSEAHQKLQELAEAHVRNIDISSATTETATQPLEVRFVDQVVLPLAQLKAAGLPVDEGVISEQVAQFVKKNTKLKVAFGKKRKENKVVRKQLKAVYGRKASAYDTIADQFVEEAMTPYIDAIAADYRSEQVANADVRNLALEKIHQAQIILVSPDVQGAAKFYITRTDRVARRIGRVLHINEDTAEIAASAITTGVTVLNVARRAAQMATDVVLPGLGTVSGMVIGYKIGKGRQVRQLEHLSAQVQADHISQEQGTAISEQIEAIKEEFRQKHALAKAAGYMQYMGQLNLLELQQIASQPLSHDMQNISAEERVKQFGDALRDLYQDKGNGIVNEAHRQHALQLYADTLVRMDLSHQFQNKGIQLLAHEAVAQDRVHIITELNYFRDALIQNNYVTEQDIRQAEQSMRGTKQNNYQDGNVTQLYTRAVLERVRALDQKINEKARAIALKTAAFGGVLAFLEGETAGQVLGIAGVHMSNQWEHFGQFLQTAIHNPGQLDHHVQQLGTTIAELNPFHAHDTLSTHRAGIATLAQQHAHATGTISYGHDPKGDYAIIDGKKEYIHYLSGNVNTSKSEDYIQAWQQYQLDQKNMHVNYIPGYQDALHDEVVKDSTGKVVGIKFNSNYVGAGNGIYLTIPQELNGHPEIKGGILLRFDQNGELVITPDDTSDMVAFYSNGQWHEMSQHDLAQILGVHTDKLQYWADHSSTHGQSTDWSPLGRSQLNTNIELVNYHIDPAHPQQVNLDYYTTAFGTEKIDVKQTLSLDGVQPYTAPPGEQDYSQFYTQFQTHPGDVNQLPADIETGRVYIHDEIVKGVNGDALKIVPIGEDKTLLNQMNALELMPKQGEGETPIIVQFPADGKGLIVDPNDTTTSYEYFSNGQWQTINSAQLANLLGIHDTKVSGEGTLSLEEWVKTTNMRESSDFTDDGRHIMSRDSLLVHYDEVHTGGETRLNVREYTEMIGRGQESQYVPVSGGDPLKTLEDQLQTQYHETFVPQPDGTVLVENANGQVEGEIVVNSNGSVTLEAVAKIDNAYVPNPSIYDHSFTEVSALDDAQKTINDLHAHVLAFINNGFPHDNENNLTSIITPVLGEHFSIDGTDISLVPDPNEHGLHSFSHLQFNTANNMLSFIDDANNHHSFKITDPSNINLNEHVNDFTVSTPESGNFNPLNHDQIVHQFGHNVSAGFVFEGDNNGHYAIYTANGNLYGTNAHVVSGRTLRLLFNRGNIQYAAYITRDNTFDIHGAIPTEPTAAGSGPDLGKIITDVRTNINTFAKTQEQVLNDISLGIGIPSVAISAGLAGMKIKETIEKNRTPRAPGVSGTPPTAQPVSQTQNGGTGTGSNFRQPGRFAGLASRGNAVATNGSIPDQPGGQISPVRPVSSAHVHRTVLDDEEEDTGEIAPDTREL